MTDTTLGPNHIAPRPTEPGIVRRGVQALDRHMIEIGVIVGGAVLMALGGLGLGAYLMLPFGG